VTGHQNLDADARFGEFPGLDATRWKLVGTHKNPWGRVPATGGGQSLDGRAREYMDRLVATQSQPDPQSRRHHYVPRTYLKRWSADGKRVWSLDTTSGRLRELSVNDVCVEENFYRVVGLDGEAHNRVEAMFGVVDAELQRIQALFCGLTDPGALQFDDLIGLGVTIAVQRLRTSQQRRLLLQHDAWLVAQNSDEFVSIDDPKRPYRVAGMHTELLYRSMWDAADLMTTRSIEVWDDPGCRFWTCDAPVLVPFHKNRRPDLISAPYILWPISPRRVVALTNEPSEEKAVIREPTGKERGMVREAVEQGRERWIFSSTDQADRLPKSRAHRRRAQLRLRCSHWAPDGTYVDPPGCCVEQVEGLSAGPDIALCNQGLHQDAPSMWDHA
jgi:hypothetical protein